MILQQEIVFKKDKATLHVISKKIYRLPLKISLDPFFIGLTYTGTIRLLYLEGDSQTKKRNPYVHRLALPTCPARLLIEM